MDIEKIMLVHDLRNLSEQTANSGRTRYDFSFQDMVTKHSTSKFANRRSSRKRGIRQTKTRN